MGLKSFCWAFVALAFVACDTSRTELVLIIDTNLAIPADTDAFRVVVDGPGGRTMTANAALGGGELPPPRTVGIVPDLQRLGPYTITVTALRAGAPRVTRTAAVTLEPQRTVQLPIFLSADCLPVTCPGQTCSAGSCRAVAIDPTELEDFVGTLPPSTDAGTVSD